METNMAKRVFLIVLDSFGIGGAPDAARFGDFGALLQIEPRGDFAAVERLLLDDADGHVLFLTHQWLLIGAI